MLQLVPVHQSGGGMSGDGSQSYAATVISAAKVMWIPFFLVLCRCIGAFFKYFLKILNLKQNEA